MYSVLCYTLQGHTYTVPCTQGIISSIWIIRKATSRMLCHGKKNHTHTRISLSSRIQRAYPFGGNQQRQPEVASELSLAQKRILTRVITRKRIEKKSYEQNMDFPGSLANTDLMSPLTTNAS